MRIAPPPRNEVNFATIDSPSLQFLPRQQEAQIWRLDEDPIVIPGDHLNTYLGPVEAPRFARYETLDLTIGKYSTLAGNGFATVEIFRFPDFVKAFGAYSQQKSGNLRFLDIPNESFAKAHSVHVWRGPFYVRITGAGERDAVQRLARFVSDRMPPAPSKPAVFAFLPDGHRVTGSERYSADAAFGQSFLGNSFQATFNVDNDVIEGIVIPAASKQTAENILDQYKGLYLHNGKLLDPIPNLGEDNFTAEDRFLGRVVAFRIDRFIVAFNSFHERQHLLDLATAADQRILGTIRKQLVNADQNAENKNTSTVPWMRKR
ncbi:MAG TPA: DUF6599 family protein [Thermoanaerobaculia bacterium]